MGSVLDVPRLLSLKNIDDAIEIYYKLLKEIPLTIAASNLLELLSKLKRGSIGKGPYPNVSIFEASNRIMTYLVILNGVKILLNGYIKDLPFLEYRVEFGNENHFAHDIMAQHGKTKLIGEAFNVSESFFQLKKSKMLKKLRTNANDDEYMLIMFNKDAIPLSYVPKKSKNEIYLPVSLV